MQAGRRAAAVIFHIKSRREIPNRHLLLHCKMHRVSSAALGISLVLYASLQAGKFGLSIFNQYSYVLS